MRYNCESTFECVEGAVELREGPKRYPRYRYLAFELSQVHPVSWDTLYLAEDEHFVVCGNDCASDGAFTIIFKGLRLVLSSKADEPRSSIGVNGGKARFLMEWQQKRQKSRPPRWRIEYCGFLISGPLFILGPQIPNTPAILPNCLVPSTQPITACRKHCFQKLAVDLHRTTDITEKYGQSSQEPSVSDEMSAHPI